MLFTIGYQGLTFEQFKQLLDQNEIDLVIDVRSKPYSHFKGFQKTQLMVALGSRYVWKPTLGGKTGKREHGYWLSLGEVAKLCKEKNVCLMCMEADPNKCHRKLWIAADLKRQFGIDAMHIIAGHMCWRGKATKKKRRKLGKGQSRL